MGTRKRTSPAISSLTLALALACALFFFARPAQAADYYVDNMADNGGGSLRQAVSDAGNGDFIHFNVLVGELVLAGGPIEITDKSITIIGPGAADMAISGDNSSRIFTISGLAYTVTISGLTFKNGLAKGADGASGAPADGGSAGMGGAIYADATVAANLNISYCAFTGNQAEGGKGGEGSSEAGGGGGGAGMGGALYFGDNLTVQMEGCLIEGNTALGGQGGLMNAGGGGGAGLGGGIFNESVDLALTNCTIANNTAQGADGRAPSAGISPYVAAGSAGLWGQGGQGNGIGGVGGFGGGGGGGAPVGGTGGNGGYGGGGGLGNTLGAGGENGGDAELGVSSGAGAGLGGGIFTYMDGTSFAHHCTIADNHANPGLDANGLAGPAVGKGMGGGAMAQSPATTGLANSIISGNTASTSDPDVSQSVNSWGYNHVTDPGASSGWSVDDTNSFDPLLLPLADNGGPTMTMALDFSSSLRNTGYDFGTIYIDQRNFPRPLDGGMDVGAYEYDPPPGVDITAPSYALEYYTNATNIADVSGTTWSNAGALTVGEVSYELTGATSGSGLCTGTDSWSIPGGIVLNAGATVLTVTGTYYLGGNAGVDTLTITVDTTPPTCDITPDGGSTGTSPIIFSFAFSEEVTDFTDGDLVVTGGTPGTLNSNYDNLNWSVEVYPDSSPSTVTVTISAGAVMDMAGNPTATDYSATMDYQVLEGGAYYVDPNAGVGGDGSAGSPWKYIDDAIAELNEGNPGTYTLTLSADVQQVSAAFGGGLEIMQDNVIIRGQGCASTIIQGTGGMDWMTAFYIYSSGVVLKDLSITGFTYGGSQGAVLFDGAGNGLMDNVCVYGNRLGVNIMNYASGIVLVDCHIHHNEATGVDISSGSNIVDAGCQIYDNGALGVPGDGVYMSSTNGSIVRGADIYWSGDTDYEQGTGVRVSAVMAEVPAEILECAIQGHSQAGVMITDASAEVTRNEFVDNPKGVWIQMSSSSQIVHVENNLIYDDQSPSVVQQNGVYVSLTSGDLDLQCFHNTIAFGTGDGIYVEGIGLGVGYGDLSYNIVKGFTGYGVFVSTADPGDVTATYNDSWGNTAGQFGGHFDDSLIGNEGNISSDPKFTSSTDFNLQGDSPCIDAIAYSPAMEDYYATSRPQGTDWDMGAVEYAGAPAGSAPVIAWVDAYQRADGLSVGVFTVSDADNETVTWYDSYVSWTTASSGYTAFTALSPLFMSGDYQFTAFEPMYASPAGETYTVVADLRGLGTETYKLRLKVSDSYPNHSNYPVSSAFAMDGTPPTGFSLLSALPAEGSSTSLSQTVLSWNPAVDYESGLAGYSWVADDQPGTEPDAIIDGASPPGVLEFMYSGANYFHIAAVDNKGNWCATLHLGPWDYDTVAPNAPLVFGDGITGSGAPIWTWASAGGGSYTVYVGGDFNNPGVKVAAFYTATGEWSALSATANSSVRALALDADGRLYAGGDFTNIGGADAYHVARYNPADGTWQALGAGVNGPVNALMVAADGTLVVGGVFGDQGSNIAIYDPDGGAWASLGSGVDSEVFALAQNPDGSYYVGGSFSQAGGSAASYAARWYPNPGDWQPMDAGVAAPLRSMALGSDNRLWASGDAVNIWDPVSQGWTVHGNALTGGSAYASLIEPFSQDFYLGGSFTQIGPTAFPYVAMWDSTSETWEALSATATDAAVRAMALAGQDLFAGGDFTIHPGQYLAVWAAGGGPAWYTLPNGPDSSVRAIAVASRYRVKLDDPDLSTGAVYTAIPVYTPDTAVSEGFHTLYVEEGDAAGNWSAAGQLDFTVDQTAPTVSSIALAGPDPLSATTAGFYVSFSEVVVGVDTTDFVVSGTAAGGVVSTVDGDGSFYTVWVNGYSGTGILELDLADDDTIADEAGNPLGGVGAGNGDFAGDFYNVDTEQPTGNIAPDGIVTALSPIIFTISFSEDVYDLSSSDLVAGNGTVDNFYDMGGGIFDVEVSPSSNGAVTLSVPAAVCVDAAGNDNAAIGMATVTYQEVLPGEYFVDINLGSDATGDGSFGTPWKTVGFAIGMVNDGAAPAASERYTITVAAGTHSIADGELDENIDIYQQKVTLRGAGAGSTIISGDGASEWAGLVVDSYGVVIEDLSINGFLTAGAAGLTLTGTAHVVRNVDIFGNETGLRLSAGASSCTIGPGNSIYWNTLNGLEIFGNGNDVADNAASIYDNGVGVFLGAGAYGNLIHGNRIFWSGNTDYPQAIGVWDASGMAGNEIYENEIYGHDGTGADSGITVDSSDPVIEANYLYDNSVQIDVWATSGGGSASPTIQNNLIIQASSTVQYGMRFSNQDVLNGVVLHNTVAGGQQTGILFADDSAGIGTMAYGNIVTGFTVSGFALDGASPGNPDVEYNDSYNNGGGAANYAGGLAGLDGVFGNRSDDPRFIGGGDYGLDASSPCIDAVPGYPTAPAEDYNGISRPQRAAFDMGAFEHGNQGPSLVIDSVTQRTDGSGRIEIQFTGSDPESDGSEFNMGSCQYAMGPSYEGWAALVFDTGDGGFTALSPMTLDAGGTQYTVVADASGWLSGDYIVRLGLQDEFGAAAVPQVSGVFTMDNDLPTDPSISTATPGINTPTADTSVDLVWTAGSDSGSGVSGYSWLVDLASDTLPDTTEDGAVLPASISLSLGDGSYYIHVRTRDNAGNWTATYHYGPWTLDSSPPDAPSLNAVTSPTAVASQLIGGNKEGGSSVWLDGAEIYGSDAGTTWSYTYFLAEGTNDFALTSKDEAGNESSQTNGSIFLDTTPPNDPSVSTANPVLNTPTTDYDVDLTWNAGSDAGSGVSGYSWAMDSQADSLPDTVEDGAEPPALVGLAEGQNYIHIRTRDNVGNWTSTYHYGPWILDTTAPGAPTVAAVTSPTNVRPQHITGGKDADTSVRLNGAEIVARDASTAWSYDLDLSEGSNNLSFTSMDEAGNESGSYDTTIVYDSTAPNNPAIDSANPAENAVTSGSTVMINWLLGDDPGGSGVEGYAWQVDTDSAGTPPLGTPGALPSNIDISSSGDADYYLHVRTRDFAGNWSGVVHFGPWTHDTTAPASPILDTVTSPTNVSTQVISGGKEADTSVWLNGYEIWGRDAGTTWSYNLVLSEGDNNIMLTCRDEAENESGPVSDNIVYDITEPTDPAINFSDPITNVPTTDNIVDITWIVGTDAGSGVSGYSWLVDQTPGTLPDTTEDGAALPAQINLSSGDGDYYIHVRTRDNAGNWTSTYHDGPWVLDTTPPDAPSLNAVTSPTNVTPQSISGNKEAGTSVWLNGAEIVAADAGTTWSYSQDLVEGDNDLSLTGKDTAGNESSAVTGSIYYDISPPVDPWIQNAVPAVGASTKSTSVALAWNNGTDTGSGVAGYSFIVDQASDTLPDTVEEGATLPPTINLLLGDGDYWIHVRTRDVAGNWTSTYHDGPWTLDTTAPSAPTLNPVQTPTNLTPQTISGGKEAGSSVWLGGTEIVSADASTAWSYSLGLAEGDNDLSLTSKDAAGNESSAATGTIVYDITEPTDPSVSVAVPVVNVPTADNVVDLTWNAGTDAGSGVSGYSWLVDQTADTLPNTTEDGAVLPASITLSLGDGDYYIHVRTRDNAGNWTSTYHYGPWVLDTAAPDAPSLNAVTSPTNVTPQSISGNKEAGTSVWLGGAEIVTADASTAWSYSLDLVEGDNDLSLTSKDTAGNESSAATGSIYYDITEPTDPSVSGAVPVVNVPTADNVVDLTWNAGTDAGSGVSGYSWLVNQTPDTLPDTTEDGAVLPASITLSLGDGDYYIHVRTRDNAGNWTSTYHYGPWVLDTAAPDAPSLNAVTSPTNVTPQSISGNKEAGTSVWLGGAEIVTADASTAWSYSLGLVEGDNDLSLTSKDAAGNESSAATGTIVYDITEPTDPSVSGAVPVVNVPTADNVVDLTWNAGTDAGSGVSGYSWLVDQTADTLPNTTEDGAVPPASITLSLGDGDYYIHVRTRDNAGNWTSTYHYGPWVLDTAAPDAPSLNAVTSPTNVTPQSISGNKESGTSVWLNGAEIVPADANTTWSYSLALNAGDNNLNLTSRDSAGNESPSATGNIYYDATAPTDPTVALANPGINTATSDNVVDLTWNAGTDAGSGVSGYSWLVDQTADTLPNTTEDGAVPPASITLSLGDGDYYIHVRTQDNAGNWTSTYHYGPWVLDTAAPDAPSLNAVTSPTTVTPQEISGNKEADSSVWLNGAEIVSADAGTTWSYSLDLVEGDNDLSLTSKDTAGNESSATTGSIVYDVTAPNDPSVQSSTPAVNTPTANTGVNITWNNGTDAVSGVAGYSWLVDRAPATLPDTTVDGAAPPASINLSSGDGSYYIHVRTQDNAGNWTSTYHYGPWVLMTALPQAPGLDAVATPTNATPQTISGTKEADTSVWLNGAEIVSIDSSTTWSYSLGLVAGDNNLSLTCKDAAENESSATVETIVYDVTEPTDPSISGAVPVKDVPTSDNTVELTWNPGTDAVSGVSGYSWLVDQSAATLPDEVEEGAALPATITLSSGDGDYYIHVRTRDNAGNWTSTYHYGPWVLDTAAPDAPSLNAVTSPTNVAIQDISGNKEAGASVWLNGAEIVAADAGTTWSHSLDLVEGDNNLSLTSKDSAGNESGAVAGNIVYDATAPTDPSISAAVPVRDVPTSDNTVELAWNAGSDAISGLSGYSWLVDQAAATLPDTTEEGAVLPASVTLSSGDGDYYIHVRTRDNAGNWTSTYHYGPWVLDTAAPDTPSLNAVTSPTNATPQEISGNKEAGASVWLNGAEIVAADAGTTWSFSLDLVEGDNNLSLTSKDSAGNESGAATGSIYYDADPPTFAIVTASDPAIGSTTADSTVDLTWDPASDSGSGVSGYSWLVDGQAGTDADEVEDGTAPPASINLSSGDGSYYIHIRARDNAGNWAASYHYGPWTLDATPPDAPSINAVTTPTNAAAQRLSGGKEADTSLWLNGEEIVPLDGTTTWSHTLDLVEGANNLSLTSRDAAGNESSATTASIYYDITEPVDPSIQISAPAVDTPTANSTVALTWNEGTDAGSGLSGYSWLVDQAAATLPDEVEEGAVLPASINLSSGDGDYYIHVRTRDNAGNWTSTYHYGPWVLMTALPQAPTLNPVTSPTNVTPQEISGGKEADTGVWLNGVLIVPVDPETIWSYALVLAEGDNNLSLTCRDAAENESSATVGNIVYDATEPTDPSISAALPVKDVPTPDNTVDLTWTPGSDAVSGVSGYSWLVDRNPATLPDEVEEGAVLPATITLAEGDGDYYIHVRTRDNAGNWTATYHYGPWMLDATEPNAPTLNAVTSPTNVTPQQLSGGKDADAGVWLNGAEIVPIDGLTTWSYDLDLVEGENRISLVSKDEAGNTSPVVPALIVYDATAPSAPTLDAVASPTNVTPQQLSGGKDANASVWLNGAEIVAANEFTSWTYDLALAEGDNDLSLTAKDEAGNESAATTDSIYYDGIAPTDPSVASADPPMNTPTRDATVDLTWNEGSDAGSGLSGYSWLVDRNPATLPDEVEDGAVLPASIALQDGDGSYYIHVRTRDNAGNWTATYHGGPWNLDQSIPDTPAILTDGGNGPGIDFITDASAVALTGTCGAEAYTVLVNGLGDNVAYVPGGTEWAYWAELEAGGNLFAVTVRDEAGNESAPADILVTYALTPGTYYVNNALGTDDLAHGRGPEAQAFSTVHYAVNLVNQGEPGPYTIMVFSGVYQPSGLNPEADLPLVITMDDLALMGHGPTLPILTAPAGAAWLTGVSVDADRVRIDGLSIGGFVSGNGVDVTAGASDFTMQGCNVGPLTGNGVIVSGDSAEILRNSFRTSGLSCVVVEAGNVLVEGNLFAEYQIGVMGDLTGGSVLSNTFVNLTWGVMDASNTGAQVRFNVFAALTTAVDGGVFVQTEANAFWQCTTDYSSGVIGSASDLYPGPADPMFADFGGHDFRLDSASVCVDATGRRDAGWDLDGLARPQYTSWDTGAYETPFVDSDGDGWPDYVETNTGVYVSERDTGTDPDEADTDFDGIDDPVEHATYGTSPVNPDTDGDTVEDGQEILDDTDPLNPYSFLLPPGAPPRFETPPIDAEDLHAMVGRPWTWEFAAQAGGGLHSGLTYDMNAPPDGAVMENVTDAFGNDLGQLSFVPQAAGNHDLDVTVTDGAQTTHFGLFTVSASEALAVTPVQANLLRTTDTADVTTEAEQVFTITGGTPLTGSSYYRLSVLREGDDPESYDVYLANDAYAFTFSSAGRADGDYFLKVTDAYGFETLSQVVAVRSVTVTEPETTTIADGSAGGVLNVEGAQHGDYAGTQVIIGPDAVPSGTEISFSVALDGSPFLAEGEQRGLAISLNATDADGNPVSLATDAQIVIPYANLLEPGDDPADLVIVHFNEATGRWERITDFVVDDPPGCISFATGSFSFFSALIPTELTYLAVGGTEVTNYAMMSFIGQPFEGNLRLALEPTLGPYDVTQWRLFAYDAASGQYVEATDENLERFDTEFAQGYGHGFWLISRNSGLAGTEGVTVDNRAGATFYTVLPPGWSIVNHPWACEVSLATHAIEVSADGETWLSADSPDNTLTLASFFAFRGEAGEPEAWYDELGFASDSLAPTTAYWMKNRTALPVYMRMRLLSDQMLCKAALPESVRALARSIATKLSPAAAIAAAASDTPPDPPGASSVATTAIGSYQPAGKAEGGGSCFATSLSESFNLAIVSVAGLLLPLALMGLLLLAAALRLVWVRRTATEEAKS